MKSIVQSGSELYIDTDDRIFQSPDNGSTWTAMNNGLQNLTIRSLSTHANYLFASTMDGGIYLTTTASHNCTDISYELKNIEITAIICSGDNIFPGIS